MNFRSKLEHMVAVQLSADWDYEPFNMAYTVSRKYTPDFVYEWDTGEEILVEVKGYFRAGDTQKYKAIAKECNESDRKFAFYLQAPTKKVRKGSKLSMGDWCDKEDIMWFDDTSELQKYVEDYNK